MTSLWLQFPEVQKITSRELASLPNLRFLRLKRVTIIGDCDNLLPELRWLSWLDCPADFSATNFSPRNLAVLKLSGSELGDDWPGWHQFTVRRVTLASTSILIV